MGGDVVDGYGGEIPGASEASGASAAATAAGGVSCGVSAWPGNGVLGRPPGPGAGDQAGSAGNRPGPPSRETVAAGAGPGVPGAAAAGLGGGRAGGGEAGGGGCPSPLRPPSARP